MGAAVAVCGLNLPKGFDYNYVCAGSGGDEAMVLKVFSAPVEQSMGSLLSGFKEGDELVLERIEAPHWLEPLGYRFKQDVRSRWPTGPRFQATRRSWSAVVSSGQGWDRREMACILQMTVNPDLRTRDNVELDLRDAKDAASYAHKFNLSHQQGFGKEGDDMPHSDDIRGVRVAAPVGCEVVSTLYPAMIPVGSACTLAVYPAAEVRKFVFDGSEDFLELGQAFFHHATFSSNGKEFVCDLQGVEDDDVGIILVDPVVLRPAPPEVMHIVGAVAPGAVGPPPTLGPTGELFDALHPKCSQLCKAFDPGRRSAKRNVGICGVAGNCGLGR